MEVTIEPSWREVLKDEFEKPYFKELATTVREAYRGGEQIFPPPRFIFNAFTLCPFDSVKVVILGQDPYHAIGQAHGLCFSVPDGTAVPPSLRNIYKEIASDLGTPVHSNGDLSDWARQGVLLLNATLTVRAGSANSHHGLGWEVFTDAVVRELSEKKEHLVFLLWGRSAMEKGAHIDENKHLVLRAPHPSPLSAHSGFFGCKHFSQTNRYLREHGAPHIVW